MLELSDKELNKLTSYLEVNKKHMEIAEENIQSYTVYSHDGLVIEKYVRETTSSDTLAQYGRDGVSVLPRFFGNWRKLDESEIEQINKEIIEKNIKKKRYHVGVTIDESKVDADIADPVIRNKLALQKAYELLQEKLKEKEVNKDARTNEFNK